MNTSTQINSATALIGPTGTGKSSLLATLALYVFQRWGLVTLYYSCDGGGFPAQVQALINKGVMRLWRLRTRGDSIETCIRAAQGWWPAEINPRTGETAPGCRLVPPVTQVFVMRCPAGHEIKRVPFQSMLTPGYCTACKTQITLTTAQVERSAHRTQGFEQVGAAMYDGLTSMCGWWSHDLQQKQGSLELKGETSAIGGIVSSGDMKFGGGNRAQVGFVQTRAEEAVHKALEIPFLVVPPVFTALTMEASDEGGLNIRGLKLAGRAKTDEAPAWFGNCLETAVVKDDHGHDVYRLNLQEYVDEQGIRHLCKHRGGPGTMPPYLQDPYGQPFSQFNLGLFFRMLEDATQKTEAEYDIPNAPGVPDGLVTYGTGVAESATPARVADATREEPAASAGGAAAAPAHAPAQAPASAGPRPAAAPVKPRGRATVKPQTPQPTTPAPGSPAPKVAPEKTAGTGGQPTETSAPTPPPAKAEAPVGPPVAAQATVPPSRTVEAAVPAPRAPLAQPRMAPPPGARPPMAAPRVPRRPAAVQASLPEPVPST